MAENKIHVPVGVWSIRHPIDLVQCRNWDDVVRTTGAVQKEPLARGEAGK